MTATQTSDHAAGIRGTARVEIATEGPQGFIERRARIDGVEDEFLFGVSPAWQSHYGVTADQFPPHATTNDVFIAALGSCLLAVYAGALEARGMTILQGQLRSDVFSDIGPVEGPNSEWIIRSIEIVYYFDATSDRDRATAERVLGFYETGCPLSQTLKGSRCVITSRIVFV